MDSDSSANKSQRELELEVAEEREWMRRRLEQKLQAQVERPCDIVPVAPAFVPGGIADFPVGRLWRVTAGVGISGRRLESLRYSRQECLRY